MSYDTKYADGHGWKYTENDAAQVRELVTGPTGIEQSGGTVLEVGCGEGFHANELRKRGLRVIAVDAAKSGIRNAKAAYQFASLTFLHWDGTELDQLFAPQSFDLLYCRGLSWHHYSLEYAVNASGVNPVTATEGLVSLLRPGGYFCLQICTDFSGARGPGVWNSPLRVYARFMERFGDIVHCSDWRGRPLPANNRNWSPGRDVYGGIVITVQTKGEPSVRDRAHS